MESRSASVPRWWIALVIVAAILAHAPSLSWGWFADDYGHREVLEGRVEHPTMKPWSLYDFGYAPRPGDELWRRAIFPWWTSSDWKGRFFRPLTSLSLALDAKLFGANAVAAHAANLGLFALIALLVHRLMLALGLSPRTALVALAVWAFEDGSMVPVGWLANRNSLLEAFFTVAAVLAALRARDSRSILAAAAALGLAVLSAASKESGISAFALVGWVLWRDLRWASIAAAALACAHLGFLVANDFGTRAIFYATPWREPLHWLSNFAQTLVAGAASMLGPFPVDVLILSPTAKLAGLALASIVVLALGVPIARAARRAPAKSFAALWILLTLAPEAGAPPSDRLLFVPMIGAAYLVASFLAATLARESRATSSRFVRGRAWTIAALALPISAAMLVLRGIQFGGIARDARNAITSLDVGSASLGARDIVLLDTPSALLGLDPRSVLEVERREFDVRIAPIQMGRRALRITRTGAASLELESRDEPFASSLFERVFLSREFAAKVGDRWSTAVFDVEAVRVDADGLRTIRITTKRSLDDERLRLFAWRNGKYERFAPPPWIDGANEGGGASIELERCAELAPFMP